MCIRDRCQFISKTCVCTKKNLPVGRLKHNNIESTSLCQTDNTQRVSQPFSNGLLLFPLFPFFYYLSIASKTVGNTVLKLAEVTSILDPKFVFLTKRPTTRGTRKDQLVIRKTQEQGNSLHQSRAESNVVFILVVKLATWPQEIIHYNPIF